MFTRRLALASPLALLGLATPAAAQNWHDDRRRRAAYERWREEEWRRRQRFARRERREWRRDQWNESREREAWARSQPWGR